MCLMELVGYLLLLIKVNCASIDLVYIGDSVGIPNVLPINLSLHPLGQIQLFSSEQHSLSVLNEM